MKREIIRVEPLSTYLERCLETAGSSLENVLKCNVYCTAVEKFAAVNAIYVRYFPKDPARSNLCMCSRLAGTFRYRNRLHRGRLGAGMAAFDARDTATARAWPSRPLAI
jgi:hypothetical protein